MNLIDLVTGATVRAATLTDIDVVSASLYGYGDDKRGGELVEDGRVLVLDWESETPNIAELKSRRMRDRQSVAWL